VKPPGDARRDRAAGAPARTATACVATLLVTGLGLWQATAGFQAWTFEQWRRAQIPGATLAAAPVRMHDGPLFPARPPDALLVDFVYTRCPGVCRTLGSEFQQLQRALARAPSTPQVRLMSISIDVALDDPPALARFADALDADPRRWRIAVPASAQDARALLRSLGVVVIPDGLGGFVHNGAIHLLDRHGRLRGLYDPGQWRQALAAAQRIGAGRDPVP